MTEQKEWGSLKGHLLTALLTIWWTFGIGNLIYAFARHAEYEKELKRQEEQGRLRALFAEGGSKAVLLDAIRQHAREGWTIQFQSEDMTQLVRTTRRGRRVAHEALILEVDEEGRITKNGVLARR